MNEAPEIIDDLTHPTTAATDNGWALVSDRVMGGMSAGTMTREMVNGRSAIRMRGNVSLENNGGFLQMALDLGDAGAPVDASRWDGIQINVMGNDQTYNVHLRTTDLQRPWESYRQSFVATPRWQTLHLPFDRFTPHRTECRFRPSRLRRLGLIAIGDEFEVDLAVADIRFYAAEAED